jgi:peptidoglycan/LPS O-acetylase OafA/YrhL
MQHTAQDLSSTYVLPKVIPQLDRLRGMAILLVVLVHSAHAGAFAGIAQQGWVGVDLFFVLSGFLITGILWDTRNDKKYFSRFYGRRMLRIWPAYLLLLFFVFGIIPLLKWVVGGQLLDIPSGNVALWKFLLMIQNLFPKELASSTFLTVTWSLAIEEQFYLVWPLVIRYASRGVVLPCLIVCAVCAPLVRIVAAHCGLAPLAIYMNPLTHGDGLLCGAAIAIWIRTTRLKRSTLLLTGVVLFLAGLLIFLPTHPTQGISHHWSPFVFTGIALLSTGLLLVALVSEHTGHFLHRFVFMNRELAFFGFISYSLYLYHLAVLRFTESHKLIAKLDRWHRPDLTGALLLLFGIGLSVLLAWTSRVTIEAAALSKKGLFG